MGVEGGGSQVGCASTQPLAHSANQGQGGRGLRSHGGSQLLSGLQQQPSGQEGLVLDSRPEEHLSCQGGYQGQS